MNMLPSDHQQAMKQIQELAAYREDYISKKGQSLSIKHICHKLRIYPTTVKLLVPELYENWNDINFHWK
jgi:hypothetical protein